MLKETSKKYEQTIIMITHNRGIAQTADRVLQVSVFDRIMGNTKYGLIGIQLDSNATEETIAEIRSLENDDIIITDQRESNKLIIPGLFEPPVRTLRFFRNYPFFPFYIIGNIV